MAINPIIGTGTADTLSGTEQDDLILGQAGNDSINALGGNDIVDGGTGDDAMNGGAGDDTYFIDSLADTITEAAEEGTDTAILEFPAAVSPDPSIPPAPNSFVLSANVENAIVTEVAGATNVTGNEAANSIIGNSFANVIDGGTGNDTLAGGGGDDTYIVDGFGDQIVETEDGGTDAVESSTSYTLAATSGVENLTLTGSATYGGGNDGDNVINGNDAANVLTGDGGNDTLDGKGGDDITLAGAGDDTIVLAQGNDLSLGNEGNDTFKVTSETAGEQTILGFRQGDEQDVIDFDGLGTLDEVNELATVTVNGSGTTIALDLDGNGVADDPEATINLVGFTGDFDGNDDGTVTLAEINAVEPGAFAADTSNGGGGGGDDIVLDGDGGFYAATADAETFKATPGTAGTHFVFGFDGTEDGLVFEDLGDLTALEGVTNVSESVFGVANIGTTITLDTNGDTNPDATIILFGLTSDPSTNADNFASLQDINDQFADPVNPIGVS